MQMYTEQEIKDILRRAAQRFRAEGRDIPEIARIMEMENEDILDLIGED